MLIEPPLPCAPTVPVMCARATNEPIVLHAVWMDEMRVSRSFKFGFARPTSHMYLLRVMPVCSQTCTTQQHKANALADGMAIILKLTSRK
eukprot:1337564-Pleurochrysis_carterae.AAC.6